MLIAKTKIIDMNGTYRMLIPFHMFRDSKFAFRVREPLVIEQVGDYLMIKKVKGPEDKEIDKAI